MALGSPLAGSGVEAPPILKAWPEKSDGERNQDVRVTGLVEPTVCKDRRVKIVGLSDMSKKIF